MTLKAAATLVLVLALPAPAMAQARWLAPYDRGLKAIAEQRWQDAITELNAAVKVADRQEAGKVIEGAFRKDYFPYVYLFIAHVKLGQLDQAKTTLARATAQPLPRSVEAVLQPSRDDYDRLVKAAAAPLPSPPPRPQPTPEPARPTTRSVTPEIDLRYKQDASAAQSALSGRRYGDALTGFEALRKQFPDEYVRDGLAVRRDEAARGRSGELVAEGQGMLKAGRLTDARARFEQADAFMPGTGRSGLAEIVSRQTEYTKFKATADADQSAGRPAEALQNLLRARDADPERYRADNLAPRAIALEKDLATTASASTAQAKARKLVSTAREFAGERKYGLAANKFEEALQADPGNGDARAWLEANDKYESLKKQGMALYRAGKLEEALQPLLGARLLDDTRFDADGLGVIVSAINNTRAHPPEEQMAPMRDALAAYLQGDTARTMSVLRPLADQGDRLDPALRAHVHGYLGAALASRAFLTRADPDQQKLLLQARDEFRLALASTPDYQLSQLVSPRIRAVLDEVRGKR